MKKILTIAIIVSVSISLAGCGKKNQTVVNEVKVNNKSQFTKLSDWLKSGKGVKCVVSSPTGEMIVKSEGKKVRIEGLTYSNPAMPATTGEVEANTGTSLTDGEWVYIWSGKQGTKMNIQEMQNFQAETGTQDNINPDDYSWEKWATDQEEAQVSYDCNNENFSNDIFTPPSDVEFSDMSKILQDMKSLSESMQNVGQPSAGAGAGVPSFEGSQSMTQEELEAKLEEMQKQLGN